MTQNKWNRLNKKAAFMVEYLDLPKATGIPDATWETFQLAFLNSDELFDISNKARQIGWSWIAAADAVANSILNPNSPHVFVSINRDEAREKIRYAKQIISALDPQVRPKGFIIENQTELELPNGSRMISNPCKPPRGKGRLNIYLDEFAHYPIADEIYTAAIPVTTRGGRVRIGSTPLGAQGKFWEIYAERLRKYPGFTRRFLPWWVARGLCTNVKMARQIAPSLDTETRVKTFGTQRLRNIYDNMPSEDFQQEYECAWQDESESWITWEEIQRNQIWATDDNLRFEQVMVRQSNDLSDVLASLDKLRDWQTSGKIERELALGCDVGRKRNTTDIILIGADREDQLPYRLGITLDRVDFATQEHVLRAIPKMVNLRRGRIDDTGLGMQLGETMEREFPELYEGATFNSTNKRTWATSMKLKFQRGQVPIPLDRELSYQLHSVRKHVSASAHVTFQADNSDDHHADKFWALALAIEASINEESGEGDYGEFPF